MPRKTTLKDIAEACGVTATTVSLALRGHARISEATRVRIQKAAREMGYEPDARLSHLMRYLREPAHRKENPVLALVTDGEIRAKEDARPFCTWKGFQSRSEQLGYRPEEFSLDIEGLSPGRLNSILRARNIRGVVFGGLWKPDFVKEMDLSELACASIGHVIREPVLSRAASDKFSNTVFLCQRLWSMGYRRIGLVIPEVQEIRVEDTFLGGYLTFHFRHRHKGWTAPLTHEAEWSPEAALRWTRKNRPDAIIAAYPGLGRHLRQHLPKEEMPYVAVINHFGDSDSPGIAQRHDLVAAAAVNLIDGQLGRSEYGVPEQPVVQLIRGNWVDGRG